MQYKQDKKALSILFGDFSMVLDYKRYNNRDYAELRHLEFVPHYSKHAEGSCLVRMGDTVVLCTVSLEERVPPFLRNSGKGWLAAEYGMLPRATNTRNQREATKGQQNGRSQEIQRLIGRSLRSCIDLEILGEKQLMVDCDVLQADGGTRTAAINGAYVALDLAIHKLMSRGWLRRNPLIKSVAAVSCGIVANNVLVDLDFLEDSNAECDANFVFAADGSIVEIQASAERKNFTAAQFQQMFDLANDAANLIIAKQQEAKLTKY